MVQLFSQHEFHWLEWNRIISFGQMQKQNKTKIKGEKKLTKELSIF